VTNDILQESYSRFLSANPPEMNPADSKSYLFRIATNLLRDRWRRRESSTLSGNPVEPQEDRLELRLGVRRAFERLKPRERQLLWLAHVEGFSHKEIAQVSGLRAGSIRLLLFRARQKLAGLLRLESSEETEPS
jgi:RNA polymerase sigma-70 factor, ECF subfamily